MSESTASASGNGKAVAVSTIAAGVIGTLASSLFSGKETRRQRAQAQVEQRLLDIEGRATQAIDRLNRAAEGLDGQAVGDSRRARRKAKNVSDATRRMADRTAKLTKRQIAEFDREAIRLQSIEWANQLGDDGSRRVRDLARALNERTSALAGDGRAQLPEWRKRASRSTSDAIGKGSALMHQAVEASPDVRDRLAASTASAAGLAAIGSDAARRAVDRTPDVLDRVSKSAHDLAEQVRHRAPDVRDRALEAASDASERGRHLADQARSQAPEVGARAAKALHHAQDAAKPVLGDAAAATTRIVKDAKEAGVHASETLIPEVQHRVETALSQAKSQGEASATTLSALGSTVGHKLSHTSEVVEKQSKAVATAAGRGTKDGSSLLVWTAAAAGIVYYAFLNPEQREKAKESGQRIVAEIKEVYRDIRGYDDEFS